MLQARSTPILLNLDLAFAELAGFDCQFDVADFHLYVHDAEVGWQPSRDFALTGS